VSKGRKHNTKKDPDYLLVPENYRSLNEGFYEAPPYHYFNQRAQNLMLVAAKHEELDRLMDEGFQIGKLKVSAGDDEELDADGERRERDRFLATEAEVLFHHCIEALMRLYLAHRPEIGTDGSVRFPKCPRLEIARLRQFSEFKERVRNEILVGLDTDTGRKQLAHVFLGVESPAQLQPAPSEQVWREGLDGIAALLSHFAGHFLSEANLYNAAKHGFAVKTGLYSIRFTPDDAEEDEPLIAAEGPSIEYIEEKESPDGYRRWHQTTTWINPDRTLSLQDVSSRMMRSLWWVAKARYVGGLPRYLYLPPAGLLGTLSDGSGIIVQSISMELLYYENPAAPK
jgi:hypothetical protein